MIKEEKLEELKRKRLIYQGLLAQVDKEIEKLEYELRDKRYVKKKRSSNNAPSITAFSSQLSKGPMDLSPKFSQQQAARKIWSFVSLPF